jgi:hypothetical protein
VDATTVAIIVAIISGVVIPLYLNRDKIHFLNRGSNKQPEERALIIQPQRGSTPNQPSASSALMPLPKLPATTVPRLRVNQQRGDKFLATLNSGELIDPARLREWETELIHDVEHFGTHWAQDLQAQPQITTTQPLTPGMLQREQYLYVRTRLGVLSRLFSQYPHY